MQEHPWTILEYKKLNSALIFIYICVITAWRMLSHKSLKIKQWSNLFVFLYDDFNGLVAVHIQ